MQTYESNRLYYRKYPFKLVCINSLANLFRGADLNYTRKKLDEYQTEAKQSGGVITVFGRRKMVSTTDFYNAQLIYKYLTSNLDYRIRVEGAHLSIYAEEKSWLKKLAKAHSGPVEFWEPSINIEPNTILMSKKMLGWLYRLTFSSKLASNDVKKWLLANKDQIKMGPRLLEEIQRVDRENCYLYNYSFYVKSERMLMLANIALGSYLSRVDKIIVEDKKA